MDDSLIINTTLTQVLNEFRRREDYSKMFKEIAGFVPD